MNHFTMKTDKLFYEFFQLAPHAVFELLQMTPACSYRYESPVVKASERRLDGLLEPSDPKCPHYFVEIQGYNDRSIYWRLVGQIGIYHQQRPQLNGKAWQAIVLFVDEEHDPGTKTLGPLYPGQKPWLITGVLPDLVKKPSLQQQISSRSPELNVLRPLAADEETTRQEGANWTGEIRQSQLNAATQEKLLNLLVQFVGQRFIHLSRKEIESMLKLTPFEETTAGKEYIQEGIEKGIIKGYKRGVEEGIEQGIEQGIREAILEILEVRFDEMPETLLASLQRIDKRATLKILLKGAAVVESLEIFERSLADHLHHSNTRLADGHL